MILTLYQTTLGLTSTPHNLHTHLSTVLLSCLTKTCKSHKIKIEQISYVSPNWTSLSALTFLLLRDSDCDTAVCRWHCLFSNSFMYSILFCLQMHNSMMLIQDMNLEWNVRRLSCSCSLCLYLRVSQDSLRWNDSHKLLNVWNNYCMCVVSEQDFVIFVSEVHYLMTLLVSPCDPPEGPDP